MNLTAPTKSMRALETDINAAHYDVNDDVSGKYCCSSVLNRRCYAHSQLLPWLLALQLHLSSVGCIFKKMKKGVESES